MIFLYFGILTSAMFAGAVNGVLKNKKLDILLFYTFIIILILFCGLRELGSDQDSVGYFNYYLLDYDRMSLAAEPSFIIISKFCEYISNTNGFVWLLFIYAIMGVYLKASAIRMYSNLPWLALIIYISYYFLLHEFTQIRAGVAAGIILISIKHIFDRNYVVFFSLIFLASMFHYSAMIVAPLYFLPAYEIGKIRGILIGMAVPIGIALHFSGISIFYIIPIELISMKVATYTYLENIADVKLNVFNYYYIVKYILLYIYLYFSKQLTKNSKYFPIFLQFYAISIFSYLALSFNAAFAMRISELMGIVEIVMLPMLVLATRHRSIAVLFVCIIALGNSAVAIFETELIRQV